MYTITPEGKGKLLLKLSDTDTGKWNMQHTDQTKFAWYSWANHDLITKCQWMLYLVQNIDFKAWETYFCLATNYFIFIWCIRIPEKWTCSYGILYSLKSNLWKLLNSLEKQTPMINTFSTVNHNTFLLVKSA